jgi:hypothetical protein
MMAFHIISVNGLLWEREMSFMLSLDQQLT